MPLGMIQENGNPCLRQGVLEEAGESRQANREAERGLLGKEWFKGVGVDRRDGRVEMIKIRYRRV